MPFVTTSGRVRYTCSDRCRQIKKRYGNREDWREALRYRSRERLADKTIRQAERRCGSLDFPFNPRYPELSMRTMVKRTILRYADLSTCGNCGRPYVPKGNRWKYWHMCSDACAASFARFAKRVEINFYANPRRTPEDVMEYLRKRKRLTLCAHCDEPFVPQKNRKYCTPKCRKAAYWYKNPHWKCRHCGETVTKGRSHYCSSACSSKYWYRHAVHCARCYRGVKPGAEVLPNAETRMPKQAPTQRDPSSVFCSERCRDAGFVPVRKICEECQQPFEASHGNAAHRRRYCSNRCKSRRNSRKLDERLREAQPQRFCFYCEVPLSKGRFKKYCADCRHLGRRDDQRRYRERNRPIPLGIPVRMPVQEGVLVPSGRD